MQSVPITTNVVSSNPGRWFSPGTPVFSTNKTDRHDITGILLKVALNTINQPTINGVMVSMLADNVEDCIFEPPSGKRF